MPSNVEIKAKIRSTQRMEQVSAIAMSSSPISNETLTQKDTFFKVANGRLKLREETGLEAKLIAYNRADGPGPRVSVFHITPVPDPSTMRTVLATSLGVLCSVKKERQLLILECDETGLRTRVHLDNVEALGRFIEFEVMIPSDDLQEAGMKLANKLVEQFGIEEEDFVHGAYADYLMSQNLASTAEDE